MLSVFELAQAVCLIHCPIFLSEWSWFIRKKQFSSCDGNTFYSDSVLKSWRKHPGSFSSTLHTDTHTRQAGNGVMEILGQLPQHRWNLDEFNQKKKSRLKKTSGWSHIACIIMKCMVHMWHPFGSSLEFTMCASQFSNEVVRATSDCAATCQVETIQVVCSYTEGHSRIYVAPFWTNTKAAKCQQAPPPSRWAALRCSMYLLYTTCSMHLLWPTQLLSGQVLKTFTPKHSIPEVARVVVALGCLLFVKENVIKNKNRMFCHIKKFPPRTSIRVFCDCWHILPAVLALLLWNQSLQIHCCFRQSPDVQLQWYIDTCTVTSQYTERWHTYWFSNGVLCISWLTSWNKTKLHNNFSVQLSSVHGVAASASKSHKSEQYWSCTLLIGLCLLAAHMYGLTTATPLPPILAKQQQAWNQSGFPCLLVVSSHYLLITAW